MTGSRGATAFGSGRGLGAGVAATKTESAAGRSRLRKAIAQCYGVNAEFNA